MTLNYKNLCSFFSVLLPNLQVVQIVVFHIFTVIWICIICSFKAKNSRLSRKWLLIVSIWDSAGLEMSCRACARAHVYKHTHTRTHTHQSVSVRGQNSDWRQVSPQWRRARERRKTRDVEREREGETDRAREREHFSCLWESYCRTPCGSF